MEIKGLQKLIEQLRQKAAKANKNAAASVVVGYTAAYALYVHENIEMKWRGFPRDRSVRLNDNIAYTGYSEGKHKGLFWGPQGQAKFLEEPARANVKVYAKIVHDALLKRRTMAEALLLAGLRLQRDSQLLVPVDTGNLKNSAFTRLEG